MGLHQILEKKKEMNRLNKNYYHEYAYLVTWPNITFNFNTKTYLSTQYEGIRILEIEDEAD